MRRDQAEATLLRALGLESGQAPEPLTYIRNSSEAFAAGRLDAEFFTPRVRDMLARLDHDGVTIRDVAPVRKERFTPAASGEFQYIEIGGIGADGAAQAESVPPFPSYGPSGRHGPDRNHAVGEILQKGCGR